MFWISWNLQANLCAYTLREGGHSGMIRLDFEKSKDLDFPYLFEASRDLVAFDFEKK